MLTSRDPSPEEDRARAVCAQYGDRPDELIEILHAIQHELGHIPGATIPVIAKALNLSRAEVYGVVSFYHDFHSEPVGRHEVKICRAESCQAMQGEALATHAQATMGTGFGETTPDGKLTLSAVYCLGLCALSPAMMVDGRPYGRVSPAQFDAVITELLSEAAE